MPNWDKATQNDLMRVANLLADAARIETLKLFRTQGLAADNKRPQDFDPVTEADRASEKAMRVVIERERPDDAILGEEFGPKTGTSGLTWVLDPIDGTRGYISGTPTWGVLVSIADETGPLFGIIDQPYIGERFSGGFGTSDFTGPHSKGVLATSKKTDLTQATIFTTFPEVGTPDERSAFEHVAKETQLTRYGMDCYAYALLAAGQIELVMESCLEAYDIQAPIAVVQAAGGVVTDWEGNPAHNGGRALAAANKEVHACALSLIREVMYDGDITKGG
jgi:histidinol phosphatase-like enzyme (inositol monophosphatase family)